MRKFNFRLESVLKFREQVESRAETQLLQKHAEIAATEDSIGAIEVRRAALYAGSPCDLIQRLSLENYQSRLDDERRNQNTILAVLQDEALILQQAWLIARQEAEVVRKLRARSLDAWQVEAEREEQARLDEFSITRRVA